jgi:glycosyltransferase involved in cell wall biosynthesis
MYHANLLAALAPRSARIIWSIHNTRLWPSCSKRSTRVVNSLCAPLSRFTPDRIVYASDSARSVHEEVYGYAAGRGTVIPNGVDLERFQMTDRPARGQARLTVGIVARYAPEKGHHFFLDVLARHPLRDRIQLVIAGDGCDRAPELREHLSRTGLASQTTLHGSVRAIDRIYAGLDVLVLPSFAEALPMVVLEAMAMGVAVCASRVGDIPLLGLPPSLLFAPGDSAGCAAALAAALACADDHDNRRRFRQAAIRYDIVRTHGRYVGLYRMLARSSAAPLLR